MPRQSKTDWDRLKKMTEEEIARNALTDPDAQPTDETFWAGAEVRKPPKFSVLARKSHHVVPAPRGGWNIVKGGSLRASKHFQRKQDAIARAKEISKRQGTDLVIHKKDGTIENVASYGRITYPRRAGDARE